MEALAAIGTFLAEHWDLVTDVYDAIVNKGVQKEDLRKMIRDAMLAAADAQMKSELGG